MANITGIWVRIATGSTSGAGTDGRIYLGIAGREFRIDSGKDDFENGLRRTYLLGNATDSTGVKVTNPERNDPRKDVQLKTENLDSFPVWIRFEVDGSSPDWQLDSVRVIVNQNNAPVEYRALIGDEVLWLGDNYGKYCFLMRS